MSPIDPNKSNLDPTRTRQGRTGRPVLYVLIAGLALALIVFVGLGFYGGSQPDENIGSVEESGATDAPAAPASDAGNGSTVVPPSAEPPAPPSAPAPAN